MAEPERRRRRLRHSAAEAADGRAPAAEPPSAAGAGRTARDEPPGAAAEPARDTAPAPGGTAAFAAQTPQVYDPGPSTVTEAPGGAASYPVTHGAEPAPTTPVRPRPTTGSRRRPGGRTFGTPTGVGATEAGEAGPGRTDAGGTWAPGNGPAGNGAGELGHRGAAHRAPISPAPLGPTGPAVGGIGSPLTGGDDRDAERGLRGLVGPGSSQVNVGAAMRARDAARPTDADLAAAEERLTIVRRNWVPREDLPRSR